MPMCEKITPSKVLEWLMIISIINMIIYIILFLYVFGEVMNRE